MYRDGRIKLTARNHEVVGYKSGGEFNPFRVAGFPVILYHRFYLWLFKCYPLGYSANSSEWTQHLRYLDLGAQRSSYPIYNPSILTL